MGRIVNEMWRRGYAWRGVKIRVVRVRGDRAAVHLHMDGKNVQYRNRRQWENSARRIQQPDHRCS